MTQLEEPCTPQSSVAASLSIVCSGRFPFIPILDSNLVEHFRIGNTTSSSSPGARPITDASFFNSSTNFCRTCRVPFSSSDGDNGSRSVFAISGSSPRQILCFEVDDSISIDAAPVRFLSRCGTLHRREIFGLAALGDSGRIVSGAADQRMWVFDALTGKQLIALRSSFTITCRIFSVAEWNAHEIFACGRTATPGKNQPMVRRYDVERNCLVGQYMSGHGAKNFIPFGLAADPSRKLLFASFTCATPHENRNLQVWDRDSFTNVASLPCSARTFSCLYVERRDTLLVGMKNGEVEVWDVRKMDAAIQILGGSGNMPDADESQSSASKGEFGGNVHDLVKLGRIFGDDDLVVGAAGTFCTLYDLSDSSVQVGRKLPHVIRGVCVLGERERSVGEVWEEERLQVWLGVGGGGEEEEEESSRMSDGLLSLLLVRPSSSAMILLLGRGEESSESLMKLRSWKCFVLLS